MSRTVTFSVSTKYDYPRETEIFTFEQLGIDESLSEKEIKEVIDRIFQAWMWDKLNISFSIVID